MKDKFLQLLTSEERQRLENISLYKLGSDEVMEENNKMSIPNDKNYINYYLSLGIPNTLGIGISKNKSTYLSEVDFLEDFGRNLDATTIQTLIQKWQSTGFTYDVTTNAGRSKWEPSLFVALASAIAHLCQGYVIVMNDNFTLDVGVYTPTVFQQAKMKFST